MTPFEVEFLLHYHCSDDEFRHSNSPAGQEAIEKFIKAGILYKREDGTHFAIHIALDLYIKEILSVPLPVQTWVMPSNTTK